jgi:aminopeptidase-like protein
VTIEDLTGTIDVKAAGRRMHALAAELYPICRSITGDGVRKTLQIIEQLVPVERHEVPTGTAVFDWQVPREWNIREAYIADSSGKRIVDFRNHSLHVLSYSVPVNERLTREQLAEHIYTLPEQPDLIPY